MVRAPKLRRAANSISDIDGSVGVAVFIDGFAFVMVMLLYKKMAYKSDYQPLQLLIDNQWIEMPV